MASLVEVYTWKRNHVIHSPILALFPTSMKLILNKAASTFKYIDQVLISHKWDTPGKMKPSSKHIGPLSADAVQQIYKETCLAEGTAEHQVLEEKCGFGYQTLLGKMMYAYVTCRPDIGYAITAMSKFSTTPSALHYLYLKHVARYLRASKHREI